MREGKVVPLDTLPSTHHRTTLSSEVEASPKPAPPPHLAPIYSPTAAKADCCRCPPLFLSPPACYLANSHITQSNKDAGQQLYGAPLAARREPHHPTREREAHNSFLFLILVGQLTRMSAGPPAALRSQTLTVVSSEQVTAVPASTAVPMYGSWETCGVPDAAWRGSVIGQHLMEGVEQPRGPTLSYI